MGRCGGKGMDRRAFLALAGTAGLAGCAGMPGAAFLSEGTRERSVTLIVPAPAGSRTGLVGRILAASLQRELARPIDILNVEGAGAAYQILASASPTGSVFGLVAADIATLHAAGPTPLGPQSVTALALLNEDPAGIHVRGSASWRSAEELTASIRAAPGRLQASGAGRRAIWHLSAHRWMTASGLGASALPWEPAPSPVMAAEALVAGEVDVVVCSVPEIRASPGIKAIKTLAVMARGRSQRYPGIATLAERGVRLRSGLWRGVAGPRGLPPELAAGMTAALRRVYAGEAFRRQMFRRGFGLTWAEGAQFAQFVETESRAMGPALRAIG